jgi:hypothetical protein
MAAEPIFVTFYTDNCLKFQILFNVIPINGEFSYIPTRDSNNDALYFRHTR